MPGLARLSFLRVLAISALLFGFGAIVACSFLLTGMMCASCFASERSIGLLLAVQSALWPTAHHYALVPSSPVGSEVLRWRIASAVLENGFLYSVVGTITWLLVYALRSAFRNARKATQ